MKRVKSIFAALLALTLALALSIPAFAAESTYTITINSDVKGHTYEAYQIFKGDLAGKVLSNIGWGTGVDGTALLTALKADKTVGTKFASAETAADVAEVIGKMGNDSTEAQAVAAVVGANLGTVAGTSKAAEGGYTISGLSAGYYLVKDQDASQKDKNDAYTRFILEVVANVTAEPKTGNVSVEKKVKENAKYTNDEGYGQGYNDVADYNIGDTVPFELIGTLPANYDSYKTYNYVFHDTKSAGLTFPETTSVKVYAGDTDITSNFTTTIQDNEMTVSCENLKAVSSLTAGSKITVKYDATLNSNAAIGLPGNPNEVYLTYSNNPNNSGSGEVGKTPTDKVIVFTYELDTTKEDGQDTTKKLAGAEFKLYKGTDSAKSYAIVAEGKLTGWTDDEAKATTLTSGEDGLFKVAGLDDGTYYLEETKAPEGYNKLSARVEVVVKATTANGQNWVDGDATHALTKLDVTAAGNAGIGDVNTGVAAITIANNSGSTLPSTGGIGTKIFTFGGIALMAGAIIVFATKRKASRTED
jgi:fimbrial isopeptide formation D2 family protein/LPXTG-motif cell wall-anchored protein